MKRKVLLILTVLSLLFSFILPAGASDIGSNDSENELPVNSGSTVGDFSYTDNGIPVINISLNGTTLKQINSGSKDDKYEGNDFSVYENGNETKSVSNVEVKGHGNSTWKASKKPYQIKFDKKTDLFGLGKAKKWLLLANALDNTLMRNYVAFTLAEKIGLAYSAPGVFVDLYIDGEYLGNYYLTHKVELGEYTVNNKNDDAVIMELDNTHNDTDGLSFTSSLENNYIVMKDVEDETSSESIFNTFKSKYNQFEQDVTDGNWEKVKSEIDVESFAKQYLIQELSYNYDANRSSIFYYTDGASDVIRNVPIWDFDNTYGFVKLKHSSVYTTPDRLWVYTDSYFVKERPSQCSQIYRKLMDIPEFRSYVEEIYRTSLAPAVQELLNNFDSEVNRISKSAVSDSKKWNTGDFYTNVNELKNTIATRKSYLDVAFGSKQTISDGIYSMVSQDGNKSIYNLNMKYTRLSDGYYRIEDITTGKVLGVENDTMLGSPNAVLQVKENDASQEWMLIPNNGYYKIANKMNDLYLTKGMKVTAYSADSSAQNWTMKSETFADVIPTCFYYNSVAWAKENNVTSGVSDGIFGSTQGCTRGQFVVFLWKLAGAPDVGEVINFTDVSSNRFYYKAIQWAYNNRIASGTSSTEFSPEKTITREQAVFMLYAYKGKPSFEDSNVPFKDLNSSKYYYPAVKWAYKNGITSGITNSKFGVGEKCTRAQMITFLHNLETKT